MKIAIEKPVKKPKKALHPDTINAMKFAAKFYMKYGETMKKLAYE